MRAFPSRLAVSLIATLALGASLADAATYRSTKSGAWGDKDTWTPEGPPGPGDEVIVSSGHTVTTDGKRKQIGTLRIESGGVLVGESPGGGVHIDVDGDVWNAGEIRGADGQPGGSVSLHITGDLNNAGKIRGGKGGTQRGGNVFIQAEDVAILPFGSIRGGDGKDGGHAYVEAEDALIADDHDITAGQGSTRAQDGELRLHAENRIVLKNNAVARGRNVVIQCAAGPVEIGNVGPAAIDATNGAITVFTGGVLDLRTNPFVPGPRLLAARRVLLLCDQVLTDPNVPVGALVTPQPIVRTRTRVSATTPARIGQTLVHGITSPNDPAAFYHGATALRATTGIDVPGFCLVPLDPGPLFYLSVFGLPPFTSTFGSLDGGGGAQMSVAIPQRTALVGMDLYTTALVFDQAGLRNLAPVARVTVAP